MPLTAGLSAFRARLRVADLLWSAAAGAVAGAGTLVLARTTAATVPGWLAIALGAIVAGVAAGRAWRRWTPSAVAAHLEARVPGLDNLVVTATEIGARSSAVAPAIRDEIYRQAADRLGRITPASAVPLAPAIGRVLAIGVGAALIGGAPMVSGAVRDGRSASSEEAPGPSMTLRATVIPPAYLDQAPASFEDPDEIRVAEGSRVRLAVESGAVRVWIETAQGKPRPLEPAGQHAVAETEWTPTATETLSVVAGDASGQPADSRLLSVVVVPDRAPEVHLVAPGRDLAFPTAARSVDVAIDARDAEALRSLELGFVRLSGAGESFTFAEGRVPLTIERDSPTTWRARARWPLATTGLEDGDSLVYRAIVRDSNPAGRPVESETFTIEIGRRLELASAGFALPDQDRRYAISQQMVIVKTERLLAEQPRPAADAWSEETRALAAEQRMVRAEVVFLSGGEVEDEEAEAEQSHELVEGRFQNTGRAEMLRAITEMSRAEARLIAGDAQGALGFERLALAALQRAFDRRRYFLRTLAERSRIDLSRRLTGDRTSARGGRLAPAAGPESGLPALREIMTALASIAADGGTVPQTLPVRLASIGDGAREWRTLAAALASATTADDRRQAATSAMAALGAYAREALAPARPTGSLEPSDLAGLWADELRRRGSR